jgi:hypothetical protein
MFGEAPKISCYFWRIGERVFSCCRTIIFNLGFFDGFLFAAFRQDLTHFSSSSSRVCRVSGSFSRLFILFSP